MGADHTEPKCFSIYLETIDCEIQWEYVHHQNKLVQLQANLLIVKSQ